MPFARAQFGQMERKVRQPDNEGCRIKNREVKGKSKAGGGQEQACALVPRQCTATEGFCEV